MCIRDRYKDESMSDCGNALSRVHDGLISLIEIRRDSKPHPGAQNIQHALDAAKYILQSTIYFNDKCVKNLDGNSTGQYNKAVDSIVERIRNHYETHMTITPDCRTIVVEPAVEEARQMYAEIFAGKASAIPRHVLRILSDVPKYKPLCNYQQKLIFDRI
eukprot:TRINITY_DN1269_c0_g2_i3.p2 TRINITY_DN1269_c0_g2~~TRINITY_DN1269_c0_g2_i3.p2  ORF type:complete len:160 (-),score=68.00 TRINITY_DN1269_c0_g2_i3:229-708(-)